MIRLSPELLKKMGYADFPESDVLEISFGVLCVYTIQGVFITNTDVKSTEKIEFGKNCSLTVSQSINAGSKLLTGDDFVENEEEWASDKNAHPPFVLIFFKESTVKSLKGGYRQSIDNTIHLHDAFSKDKIEIEEWKEKSLPNIITSLTVHFSTLEKQVKIIPIEESIFGSTKDGKTVFDTRFSMSAEMVVSSPKEHEEVSLNLKNAKELFLKLNEKSSRHIYSALIEPDRLKQFLSYFLFIERYTHSEYSRTKKNSDIESLLTIPSRLSTAGLEFFKSFQENAHNLSQKFLWCSLLVWENIDNHDISDFKEVKKVRDKISHGEDIHEAKLPVEKIKTLSLKLALG